MKNLSQSRYFEITLDEVERIKSSVNLASGWCNENECKETMIEVWNNDKYMLDPHTSVAVKVAKSFQREDRYCNSRSNKSKNTGAPGMETLRQIF